MSKRKPETREERVRRMVPDRATWPNGTICMKRIVVAIDTAASFDTIREFGFIMRYTEGQPVDIYPYAGEAGNKWAYPNLDALIEAGWVVD